MGTRGQQPKPTRVQIAEGDPLKHGVHKLAEKLAKEPKPTEGYGPCPEHLKGRARDLWEFWTAELEVMDLDRKPDGPMLEGACIAYDVMISTYETIQAQGRFIAKKAVDPETKKLAVVDVKTHPAVRQQFAAMEILRAFCTEFGFTPVARTRLAIESMKAEKTEADFLELLNAPRDSRIPLPVQ